MKKLRFAKSLNNDHIHYCKITQSNESVIVTVSDRFEVDITCGYNHTMFPFDTQFCLFRFGVQNYPIGQMRIFSSRFLRAGF